MGKTSVWPNGKSCGNHFIIGGLLAIALLLNLNGEACAQGVDILGENTHLYLVNPGDPWGTGNTRVDSVYLGAAFLRDTSKVFRVWLGFSETSVTGSLALMIPHGANNGSDTTIFLFLNTAPLGTSVDLTNDPVVKAHIKHLDTIYFRYYSNAPNNSTSYSGPNRAPGDGFQGTDYFYSPDRNTSLKTGPTGQSFPIGRRWCTAGWIRNHTTNLRTDTVRFAFEDWHTTGSDFDLNDIVFNVTGIFLMFPISDINVSVFPSDTLMAGDTARIIGVLRDQSGKVQQSLGDSISWSQIGTIQPGDRVLNLKNDTTKFTATQAYRSIGIVGTFTQGGKTVYDTAWLYIKPAPASHLVIEPNNTALTTNPNFDNPLRVTTIGPTQTNARGYAALRDRFGNFVRYSQSTAWGSTNTSLVTIPATGGGNIVFGEGVITKAGSLIGTARVGAKDNALGFVDTVTVNIEQVTYSPLRIVVRNTDTISTLQMRSDQDTLLQVLGRRSTDGEWVPINGNWAYIATLGGTTASGLPSWRFKPTDTGTGIIIVTFSQYSTPDTITVKILPGLPNYTSIYNSELPPNDPGVAKLPDPSRLTTIQAGTKFTLVGKVFDWRNVWLSTYQLSTLQNNITWGASDRAGNLNSTLDGREGAVRVFTPTKAYDTVTIIDSLRIDATHFLMDTARFYITPGPAKEIVIEPKGTINVNRSNPVDTLKILFNETTKPVYTTVRDSFGNFIRYGKIWLWESRDSVVASIRAGDSAFGEGIATRFPSATDSITIITASDSTLKDNCFLKLEKYYYTDLRIVIGNDTNPANLTMNTNQDTTLKVQGKRSDNLQWVNVTATWENTPNLKIVPVAPTNSEWRFSPSDTGTGWIRVTLNNDGVTKPDTLPVHFTPGPPVRATFEILTPLAQIIAGKPVTGVIMIYDKDGNNYTYNFDTTAGSRAAFHDLLGSGGATFPEPFIMVDGKKILLDETPWGSGNELFTNGRDTVTFTLFNAPLDTTKLHQISVNLTIGTDIIRASTTPFVLHPDVLAQVRIEYPNGTPVADSLDLDAFIRLVARGYDQFGNPYGEISGNWSVTDSLHPISGQTNGSSISYDPSIAVKNVSGHIIVNRDGIRDSVFIQITGPLIKLVKAVTRDVSGNGILDQIELYFSRPFELPPAASFAGMTIIANQKDTLVAGSILNTGSGRDTSVWTVQLVESNVLKPQTSWTPTVTLPLQSAYDIGLSSVVATDGAGPVVWRVVTYPVIAGDHRSDTVVVTFSEPVQRFDGGSLDQGDMPWKMLYVWQKNTNDTTQFMVVKAMLAGINNLKNDPGKGAQIVFTMTNGNDLNRGYYVSIADTNQKYVTDTTMGAIEPNMNNKPRQVEIGYILGPISITNPIKPIFTHDKPGSFPIIHRPEASKWVRDEKGGAVIKVSFPTLPPEETAAKLRYTIKIYDIIGNLVQTGKEDDFIGRSVENNKYTTPELEHQSTAEAIVYWNGANAEGMTVAPGVYRAVVYLQYTGLTAKNRSKFSDQRFVAKLGIQR